MTSVKLLTGYEHITKFNGCNFPLWRSLIWDAFRLNDVCPFALGLETNECALKDETGAIDQPLLPSYSRKNVSWNKNDIAARVLITATVEEKWQRQLTNCSSAREMWMTVEQCHRQYLSVNGYAIQQRFFNYRCSEDSNVKTIIREIEALANQLSDLGQPVSEFQMISKILDTLPKKFRYFASMWQMLPDDKKTLAQLILQIFRQDQEVDDSVQDAIEESNSSDEVFGENDSMSAISFRSASSSTVSTESIHSQRKRKHSLDSKEVPTNKRSQSNSCDQEFQEGNEEDDKKEEIEEIEKEDSQHIHCSRITDVPDLNEEKAYLKFNTPEDVLFGEDCTTQTEPSSQNQLDAVDKVPLDEEYHSVWVKDVLH